MLPLAFMLVHHLALAERPSLKEGEVRAHETHRVGNFASDAEANKRYEQDNTMLALAGKGLDAFQRVDADSDNAHVAGPPGPAESLAEIQLMGPPGTNSQTGSMSSQDPFAFHTEAGPPVQPQATTTDCVASDTTELRAACKCATGSPTNECTIGKYCWTDNTCNDAEKASITDCVTSDTTQLRAPCKCATASATNECESGKFCWIDNTCHDAEKEEIRVPEEVLIKPLDIENKFNVKRIALQKEGKSEEKPYGKEPEDPLPLKFPRDSSKQTVKHEAYTKAYDDTREALEKHYKGIADDALGDELKGHSLYSDFLSKVWSEARAPQRLTEVIENGDKVAETNDVANKNAFQYVDDLERLAHATTEGYNRMALNHFYGYDQIMGQIEEGQMTPGRAITMIFPFAATSSLMSTRPQYPKRH